jgi:kynurenine formamidase
MEPISEWRRAGDAVRNWGRWGPVDERGTLNLITPAKVRESAGLVRTGRVFPLGIDVGSNGPQRGLFSFRQNPVHLMTVDGGDAQALGDIASAWSREPRAEGIAGSYARGPFRFNDDVLFMPVQSGTHWDALSHVYYEGEMYNGFPAATVTSLGAFRLGIDKVESAGIVSRGVLLDVVRHRGGGDHLAAGHPVSAAELAAVARAQDVEVRSGDVVLVRTGWQTRFRATGDPLGDVAGLHWRCVEYFSEHDVAAVAADNVALEDRFAAVEDVVLPLHLLALRDMGLTLGQLWDLDELAADCARDGVYEFQLVAPPLRIVGGIGSPLNPVAIK